MMETKYWMGLLVIASILTGGIITYNVVETGNELTCRTNKPIGWDIIAEHEEYYEAVCPYKTKEPVYANCSNFRATGSYERYGCNEVMIIEVEEPTEEIKEGKWGSNYKCYPNGCDI